MDWGLSNSDVLVTFMFVGSCYSLLKKFLDLDCRETGYLLSSYPEILFWIRVFVPGKCPVLTTSTAKKNLWPM